MNHEEEYIITCPYCGEQINVLIDCTYNAQEYIEDCQVCCRPISFQIHNNGHSLQVNVKHENE